MLLSDPCLCLRKPEYSETSQTLTLLSRTHGLLRVIAKGRSRDTAWYAMLDLEWPARKRELERWLSPDNFDAHGRQRASLTSGRL